MSLAWNMGGNMEDFEFEEFTEKLKQKLSKVVQERDKIAMELPNILNDPEYLRYLTIEYNFTDRVN
jgi:hypothetical protein|tara:strand:- start:196 stop:393 length:198 start_codon:yes stop_codon:yes gene_type:complete